MFFHSFPVQVSVPPGVGANPLSQGIHSDFNEHLERCKGEKQVGILKPVVWTARGGQRVNASPFCLIGILNVTPDSFSDGGFFFNTESAVSHGLRLLDEGAEMLDIGAESTRPLASAISAEEEQRRLVPVLEKIRRLRPRALVSVDTFRAETARCALEKGADVINDVSACSLEPALLDILVQFRPGYVLMHSQGRSAVGRDRNHAAIVEALLVFFERNLDWLVRSGLPEDRIAIDPGIGFGKSHSDAVEILRNLECFQKFGRPLYVGLSRKSLFDHLLDLPCGEREEATHLAVALLAARGIVYHRVHDVAGCSRALRLASALTPGFHPVRRAVSGAIE